MKANARWVRPFLLATVLLGLLSPTAGAQSPASTNFVGVQAIYAVTSTATAADGSVASRSQRIEITVTAQQLDRLTIRSAITQGGVTRQIEYELPAAVVLRPVPGQQTSSGGQVSFTDSRSITPKSGVTAQITQVRQTDGVWFQKVVASVTGQSPEATLQVDLVQKTVPSTSVLPATGTAALWLLPSLAPPDAGVQVLSASGPPLPSTGTAGPAQATASASAAATKQQGPMQGVTTQQAVVSTQFGNADSRLTTIDNPNPQPLGSFPVWYSDLHVHANRTDYDDGSKEADYYAEIDAQSVAVNWFRQSASVNFQTGYTVESATALASSAHFGIFPFFQYWYWWGEAYHQITINRTGNRTGNNHQTWLSGSIENCDITVVPCRWALWKDQRFENGGTYPNGPGVPRQDHSWYVV